MKYLKWFLLATMDIASSLIALIISPGTSFFVDEKGDMRFLRGWLQTPDSDMFGNPGDAGFYEKHKAKTESYLGRVWVCFLWQWRNTAQGFSQNVLGFDTVGYAEIRRKNMQGNRFDYEFVKAINGNGKKSFQFKGSFYWSAEKRFRLNVGWKLNMAKRQPKCQIVVSVGPYTNR